MEIKEKYLLAPFTTFKIGGTADYFCDVENVDELNQALDFARGKSLPVFILGNGSNILVSDAGFRGLVIHNKIQGSKINDQGSITVGAGENWDNVVLAAINKDLAGIECLSAIPGSAGGAVVQNIGAYGQTLGDLVVSVEAVEVKSGKPKKFTASESEFVYRNSFFKRNPSLYVITGFELKLLPNSKPNITYAEVAKHFAKQEPSLAQVRDFIIQVRASKGYLIMPGFESFQTAGSYFKNPIVSKQQFEKLQPMLGSSELNRYWEMSNGVKIAAAYLLQEAGFAKGYQEGHVGISPKHSLSLVNFGGAQASEIQTLARKIKSVVLEKFGVELEEEILYV